MGQAVVGTGQPGTPNGGLLTVQGDPDGTPIPVAVSEAISLDADIANATAAAPTYGEGTAVALSVDLAGNLRSRGAKTNNAAAPTADNLGVLPVLANAAAPSF